MVKNSTIALFLSGAVAGGIATYLFLKSWMEHRMEKWKNEASEGIKEEALERSRSVLKGKIGEHIAPFTRGFNYEPSDCRFIGAPIDYLIFEGLSEGKLEKIVLADIKTGKQAGLTEEQKEIKKLVKEGDIEWKTLKMEVKG